ncbi:conserved Plasmodium membrane [Babesia ovata]|uniref:Conserved Plasmodium membrane n=1 Tax=Babesia ovata TaxID=189622 RepID=A0A2H6KHP3_9APIC|nr:conserved Plasmodium membrane [Babesia ovata]GBE62512.1 conserved Plasmodium membrane [Babesia ovata]
MRGSNVRDNFSQGATTFSKRMERKLAQGEVGLQPLEEEQSIALSKTLQLLIGTSEVEPQVKVPDLENVNNTRITYSKQIIQELSEQRYKERLQGVSAANSVQYIPFRAGFLGELHENFRTSILSLLVALVVDYIAKSRYSDQDYLIKWGSVILKRIGKLLKLSDMMLDAIMKPVTQYVTLKHLNVDISAVVKKQQHIDDIHKQLEQMQPELDREFKKSVEDAKNYLNSPLMSSRGNRRTEKGLLGTISKKINRVLSRAMEPNSHSINRTQSESSEIRTDSIDVNDRDDDSNHVGAEGLIEDDDSEIQTDFSLNDELLLDSVPGCAVLLRSLVTGYITSGYNDSRVQLLFQEFSAALGMSTHTVLALENHIAADIVSAIHATANSGTSKKVTRNIKIAAMAAGGGALLAVSAGMATPAVAAGLAVLGIGGGGVSGLWATTEEAELLASVFGVGSNGLSGWKSKKDDVAFHHINEQSGRSLAVCIGVCGSLAPEVDILALWEDALRAPLCDFYAMQWETTLLKSLGNMFGVMEEQPFAQSASMLWQKQTAGEYLACGIQWPLPLIHFAEPLDNTWTLAIQRARQYGATLAQAIMDRNAVGERPISLVGYSVGAKVIVYALLKLKEKQKLNLVKDVVLMGLPSTAGPEEWLQCRSVVAGRIINVYSRHDWLLGYLYRDLDAGFPVAGLRPVGSEVENYDATEFIKGHHEYMCKISEILTLVHVDL